MSFMSLARIRELRESLEAESIDLVELSEIQEAYHHWANQSTTLSEDPDNAMAADMLNELEADCPDLEFELFDYIKENYGESEALDPCYNMGEMVAFILEKFNVERKNNES